MATDIEPAKIPGTDSETSSTEDWRNDGTDGSLGGRDLIRSVPAIVVGSVAIGIAAVAVIGVRLNRRRKSKTPLGRAAAQAEDAMDTLVHAAAGLSERGKAAVRRVRN
ncbi:hypothetical protein [Glycomyces sp. YM15]|uniref:hypothetical protein n=1 Tax=Glycomyces sp. YM15 TaxID=2800446 RepID=UPI00196378F6|nr:hypothetical protein [Glycomyces sp. YM15]